MGLVKSIRNFDTEYGVAFSTYAVPVIMGEIRRFLRDDGAIRISRSIRDKARLVMQCVEDFEETALRHPSMGEIAEQTGLSSEEVLDVYKRQALSCYAACAWENTMCWWALTCCAKGWICRKFRSWPFWTRIRKDSCARKLR